MKLTTTGACCLFGACFCLPGPVLTPAIATLVPAGGPGLLFSLERPGNGPFGFGLMLVFG